MRQRLSNAVRTCGLWLSEDHGDQVQSIPYWELMNRGHEMFHCKSVDPAFGDHYDNMESEYLANEANRYMNFLNRNGLFDRFLAADAQGKR